MNIYYAVDPFSKVRTAGFSVLQSNNKMEIIISFA